MTEGMDGDQRKDFMEELYAEESADDEALTLLRQDMERRGMEWEADDEDGDG